MSNTLQIRHILTVRKPILINSTDFFYRMDINMKIKQIYHAIIILIFFSCGGTGPDTLPTETDLFNKSVPAVVVIYAFDSNFEMLGQGTGFVIDQTGIIATNYHVIENSFFLRVAFTNGEKFEVSNILNTDAERDIALLKIKGYDLPKIPLGNSNKISIGDKVIAIGNPLGLSNTLSSGIISGIRTDLGYKLIQTTTPISPGSSGGPLLNAKGEVIGLTTMYLKGGQNLNFAVPINYLMALLQDDNEQPTPSSTIAVEDLELKKELADKYYNDYKIPEAIKLYEEIAKADTSDPFIFYRLGYCQMELSKYTYGPLYDDDPLWKEYGQKAIKNFEKAISINPENEWAYYKIANTYGIWVINALKNKNMAQFKNALSDAQNSGGYFPHILEASRAMLTSCDNDAILFTSGYLAKPLWYLQEVEKVRTDVTVANLFLMDKPFYIKYLRDFKGIDLNLTDEIIDKLNRKSWPSSRFETIALEDNGSEFEFLVESLPLEIFNSEFKSDEKYLEIPDQLVLEILKRYINGKSIYFSQNISWSYYSLPRALWDHLVLEGLVYKLVPQPKDRSISFNNLENNLLQNYRYTIFRDPRVFGINVNYDYVRMYRDAFNYLAKINWYRGNQSKVKEILEFKETVIPENNIPIPYDDRKEIYENGELEKIYSFSNLKLDFVEKFDHISDSVIVNHWIPTATDSPSYYYNIADFYNTRGRYEKSIEYCNEYLKYEPDDENTRKLLASNYRAQKEYGKTINILEEMLINNPDEVLIFSALGQQYTNSNNYQKAKSHYEKAIEADRNNPDLYNPYGLILLYEHKYDAAIKQFERVLNLFPGHKYALENIAETFKAEGKIEKAKDTFIQVVEKDPTLSLVYSKLAIIEDIFGNKEKSEELLQIAKDNLWEGNYGQIGLACYYSYKNDISKSLAYLKQALELEFHDIPWLKFDPDLENVRQTEKFWKLIEGK